MKSKDIYKILIRTKPIPKSKAKEKYSLTYNLTEEAEWKKRLLITKTNNSDKYSYRSSVQNNVQISPYK